ncbi:mannitol dehydrogenase family protein [Luethyella okanaganae]|uniref:Mannitol dehydrogenase family protein n=1 Tax=Luethyella okanaganae TaxID=69372 RepID=A0ABW1VDG2_9MICO
MNRLTPDSLARSGRELALDRAQMTPGIVHLGSGGFFRAHVAAVTEDAMAATDDLSWGIIAVTQRSADVAEQLNPQCGLFTVTERQPDESSTRVVSSVLSVIDGHGSPGAIVDAIADRRISVVTLTITEKGYRFDARSGRLDLDDPAVQADLSAEGGPERRSPTTAVGQIAAGLRRRFRGGAGAITVVSCDNLPANGRLTQTLVRDFLAAAPDDDDDELAVWIDTNVRFPSTMVDRMVPATSPDDLDEVERFLGLRDEGAVVAEPFWQWVVEDDFAGSRPPWERVGVQFTDDVAPWEKAKLRLLNAAHSLLAYLGLLAGYETIAETVADPAFERIAARMIADEALPSLTLPRGFDGPAYCGSVLRRFANPALGHSCAKVASDGSQKLGIRILPTMRDALARGEIPTASALAVASWMHRVATTPVARLDDPAAAELVELAAGHEAPDEVVSELLTYSRVFDAKFAANPAAVGAIVDWYVLIAAEGSDGLKRKLLS